MNNSENNIVIIGAGPAGLSLSASLQIAGIDHIIIEKSDRPGGQTKFINNKLDDLIVGNIPDGKALVSKFTDFVNEHKLPIVYNCEVTCVDAEAKSVIFSANNIKNELKYNILVVATGSRLKYESSFQIKGFENHIYYRISQHLNDFSQKTVAILGSGDNAAIAALKLSEIASMVFLINRSSTWKARKDLMVQIYKTENIQSLTDYHLQSISGIDKMEEITFSCNKEAIKIKADKLVFKIGYLPNTEFLNNVVNMTDKGYLICDGNFRTSDASIYGIGDVLSSSFKRISIAISQGTLLSSILV